MNKLDLDQYITKEQKQEIAKTVFRDVCLQVFREDSERIFSNAAYEAVWREVDASYNGKTAEIIRDKIHEVISELTPFSVFREAGGWGGKASVAQQTLDQAVRDNEGILREKVKDILGSVELSKEDILEVLLKSGLTIKVGFEDE